MRLTRSTWILVDGGKDALVKSLVDVTSNVKDTPGDPAPYGSFLLGRLAAYADLPVSTISLITLSVEVEKDTHHVKMWRSVSLDWSRARRGSMAETMRRSRARCRGPRPAEERDLVENTGMGWVEQVVLRGAMALGVVLSREQVHDLGHEGDALVTPL